MTKVKLPYDADWQALTWAKKHCPSYITNNSHVEPTTFQFVVVYFFSDEKDATAFTLKWS